MLCSTNILATNTNGSFVAKMSKRKRVFTQSQAKSRRDEAVRRNETEAERERRLTITREGVQRMREGQSKEKREDILEKR